MADKGRDREEFIKASSRTDYYPYSWELDGHPAMQRTPLRRLRHGWKQTRADWVRSIILLAVLGGIFGIIALIAALR